MKVVTLVMMWIPQILPWKLPVFSRHETVPLTSDCWSTPDHLIGWQYTLIIQSHELVSYGTCHTLLPPQFRACLWHCAWCQQGMFCHADPKQDNVMDRFWCRLFTIRYPLDLQVTGGHSNWQKTSFSVTFIPLIENIPTLKISYLLIYVHTGYSCYCCNYDLCEIWVARGNDWFSP